MFADETTISRISFPFFAAENCMQGETGFNIPIVGEPQPEKGVYVIEISASSATVDAMHWIDLLVIYALRFCTNSCKEKQDFL